MTQALRPTAEVRGDADEARGGPAFFAPSGSPIVGFPAASGAIRKVGCFYTRDGGGSYFYEVPEGMMSEPNINHGDRICADGTGKLRTPGIQVPDMGQTVRGMDQTRQLAWIFSIDVRPDIPLRPK